MKKKTFIIYIRYNNKTLHCINCAIETYFIVTYIAARAIKLESVFTDAAAVRNVILLQPIIHPNIFEQ